MSEPRWIKLHNGQYFCVDDEDYEWAKQFKWQLTSNGYIKRNLYIGYVNKKIINKQVAIHREIMRAPEGMDVDHINRDKLDNRKSNLRICTRSQNLCNRSTMLSGTGYVGVYPMNAHRKKDDIKYKFHVKFGDTYIKQYGFSTPEEAAIARNAVVVQIQGEFARLNEVPQC